MTKCLPTNIAQTFRALILSESNFKAFEAHLGRYMVDRIDLGCRGRNPSAPLCVVQYNVLYDPCRIQQIKEPQRLRMFQFLCPYLSSRIPSTLHTRNSPRSLSAPQVQGKALLSRDDDTIDGLRQLPQAAWLSDLVPRFHGRQAILNDLSPSSAPNRSSPILPDLLGRVAGWS